MNHALTGVEHYRGEFARVRDTLPGGPELAALREAALAEFARRGFPGIRDEDWRYTSMAPIERHAFGTAAGGQVSANALAPLLFAGLDCHLLVFVDGRFDAALSRAGELADGVRLQSLREALAHDGARLAPLLDLGGDRAPSPFVAMNTAFTADGAWLEVPRGVTMARPVHLLFLATDPSAGLAQYPRVLIEAGAGAAVTVIEHYVGLEGAANLTNTVTTVRLGDAAALEHYKLQQESAQALHVGWMDVEQGRDSRFTQHSISLGARLARHDIRVRLAAPGAGAVLNGLYLARDRQHVDHHTRVDHLVAHTSSEEDYRGVLDGHGRGVFNGKVVVHEQAQKSVARQSNRNLLLAATAEIDTKPELEIYADDVQCSHGATVGQLDEQALFYLRSRGIDAETARTLLIYAFADDVVMRLALAPVRQRLEAEVLGRMPDADKLRNFV